MVNPLLAGMTDVCTVTGSVTAPDENGIERKQEVILFENLMCRISFSSFPATSGDVAAVSQGVKLFLPPGTDIPPGSQIAVTRDGKTILYRQSSAPAIYPTHVEINLELEDRWA